MAAEICICGQFHPAGVETVVIGESAVLQLGEYAVAHRWTRPFVVMDQNTAEVLGYEVIAELRRPGVTLDAYLFEEREGLLADESAVERLDLALRSSSADALVAVGSGVITDLTRFVAHRQKRSFVSVPTAASMDGYASSVAAMEFGGMKVTFPAVAPEAIFADPIVVKNAPVAMTRSGIGDLLGKASAHFDWALAAALFGEERCSVVEARVATPMIAVAQNVSAILERSTSGVHELLSGLIESGVAMAMVNSSRPASGCEHHASHFWDQLVPRGLHVHAPHGLQVGYATHFALRLQHVAMQMVTSCPPPPYLARDESVAARSWFAGHDDEVDAVLEEKNLFLAEHLRHWPGDDASWDQVVATTHTVQSLAPLVDAALTTASIPAEVGFLGLDLDTLHATFRYANRMRARYTVIDFLEGQGLIDSAVESALGSIAVPIASM